MPETVRVHYQSLQEAKNQVLELYRLLTRLSKKHPKASFDTYEELNTLLGAHKKHKLVNRSELGVKTSKSEFWLSSISIGNVMHLAPLSLQTFEPRPFASAIKSVIEKQNLLYTVFFALVAFFCAGTELRFLAMLKPVAYHHRDSDVWHAKAIRVASSFVPPECPLAQHIIESYVKHHLRPKTVARNAKLKHALKLKRKI